MAVISIDHLQVTVKDMVRAEPFYDKLMPVFGFDLSRKVYAEILEHDLYVVEYLSDTYDFGICSPRTGFKKETVHRRKPGAVHHIAFRGESRGGVDRLYGLVREAGAEIVHAPRIFPEHGENYYAFFFKDPDGIKYEVVYNP